MAWATPEEVKNTTGKDVSPEEIAVAGSTIELRTGVLEEQVTTLGFRDRRFLKLAVAYQTAWLAERPDAFDRDDVASLGQDGVSAALKPWANTLAPHARLALKRLSWKGTRSTSADLGGTTDEDTELDVHGRPLVWKKL